jgi:IS5 family transposase
VRRVVVTSGKVYESEVADALIAGDEPAVYGDRAYPQKARHARLAALGIKDRLMRRASKHHPVLPPPMKQPGRAAARPGKSANTHTRKPAK